MRPIPIKLRMQLMDNPSMNECVLRDEHCHGSIQWDHALTYAGKQVNEAWAIIPVCEAHHGAQHQRKREWLALSRAIKKELKHYPKIKYKQRMQSLEYIIDRVHE